MLIQNFTSRQTELAPRIFVITFLIELSTIFWNSIPDEIKLATSLDSFKRKLKSLFFWRLHYVFIGDNIGSYKIISLECRGVNIRSACSC